MKKLILVLIAITMSSIVFAQKDGMVEERDSWSGRFIGEGEMKNQKKVGIWKYYSKDGAYTLADYGDGSGEPITKYFDRKEKLVFIGDHYVQDFFLQAFEVGEFNNEPYQYFIGFEDLKEEGVLLNGLWKEYNENGVLILRTKLVDGTRDGLEEEYYDSGNLRVQRFYFEGDLDLEEIYYDSGNLKRKCYHYKGKLDIETCRYYDENGNERLYDLELASVFYYDNKDYKNAYIQFKEAAKDGDDLAKQFLAMMYQDGQGVEKELDMALKLFDELCEKNISNTCKMADNIHLEKGSAFLKNKQYTQAIYHFKKVSTTENLDTQFNASYNLGYIYYSKMVSVSEEMNKVVTDFKKYDELKIILTEEAKQSLKYFEKAYKIKPSEDLSATINSIKSILK